MTTVLEKNTVRRGFHVKQESFEGPLQLLLELIEKEKLPISGISLSRVTDEYMVYIKSLERIDPEALAEFLVVAAQLALIKSRSLLPSVSFAPEETASIEDLQRRLEELRRMRKLAKELCSAAQGRFIWSREAYAGLSSLFYMPPRMTLDRLEEAFSSFLVSLPKVEKLSEEKLKRVVSIQERIAHLRGLLMDAVERAFSELVSGSKEKIEVIVSFLAMLELARQRAVELRQEALFGEIMVTSVKGTSAVTGREKI